MGKINVFVGANNSGKSRLIRAIARNQKNTYEIPKDLRLNGELVRDYKEVMGSFLEPMKDALNSTTEEIFARVVGQYNQAFASTNLRGHVEGKSVLAPINDFFRKMTDHNYPELQSPNIYRRDFCLLIQTSASSILEKYSSVFDFDKTDIKFKHIYIPTLRSLRDLGDKELFKNRTVVDYSLKDVTVFTGQSMYDDVEYLLRGSLAERHKLRDFEEWLSKTFFEGKSVALIPRIKQTTLTIKIGEEKEKPIHELGDGIQSILILTFELFRHADEHVLAFIEEPELFLHPWLQRVFLEVLAKKFPKHQYFLTTHSNHFLDMTLDVEGVSLFLLDKKLDDESTDLEKTAQFKIHPISRDDRKPLEILGVRNSSVLLSNCTLWVEGITDRRYIAHWLDLYNNFEGESQQGRGNHRVYKEDLHYSFMEYAGACITHYSFLEDQGETAEAKDRKINVEWLCGRLFLITDQDGVEPGSKKEIRQNRLAEKLGEHYYCLTVREIENLIKPEILMKVLQSYGEKEYPAPPHSEYTKVPLGTYIDEFLAGDPDRVEERRYAEKPQKKEPTDEIGSTSAKKAKKTPGYTIRDKTDFCQKAIEATTTWSDLTEEAQELTLKLYSFIRSRNQ